MSKPTKPILYLDRIKALSMVDDYLDEVRMPEDVEAAWNLLRDEIYKVQEFEDYENGK